jgi:hypothetical protein
LRTRPNDEQDCVFGYQRIALQEAIEGIGNIIARFPQLIGRCRHPYRVEQGLHAVVDIATLEDQGPALLLSQEKDVETTDQIEGLPNQRDKFFVSDRDWLEWVRQAARCGVGRYVAKRSMRPKKFS